MNRIGFESEISMGFFKIKKKPCQVEENRLGKGGSFGAGSKNERRWRMKRQGYLKILPWGGMICSKNRGI